jgi:hypothetical protein
MMIVTDMVISRATMRQAAALLPVPKHDLYVWHSSRNEIWERTWSGTMGKAGTQ